MSKQTIIKGTLILTITGILTKFLGFYNRIFLTRLIGVKELGIYQLIFPVYILSISFCCQGIATTISKQVSYARGKQDLLSAKKILRYGLALSFSLSILISFLLRYFYAQIADCILKNSDCKDLLVIASVAIPFVSIKACINAYYMGFDKPIISGSSQLFEQIVRISSAYVLSVSYMSHSINAKMAMIAVVVGEICAMVCVLLLGHIQNKKTEKKSVGSPGRHLMKNFLSDAIPITTNNLMFNLFSSFEAIILPSYLYLYVGNADRAMELFGTITGIVIPFLLFPATITTALSTVLLPNISYANANLNLGAIKKALTGSALFCLGLGCAAWIFYGCIGTFLCQLTFQSAEAGKLLAHMSFLCPIIYLSGTMSAIMNAMNLAFINLIYNIIGILVRICFTVFFVPVYGIPAYIIGMACSYIISTTLIVFRLRLTFFKQAISSP